MKKNTYRLFILALLLGSSACSQYSGGLPNAGLAAAAAVGGTSSPTGEMGSTAPQTYKNADRKFHFTIPAGWTKISGEPNSATAVFRKVGTSEFFQFNYTAMASNFPAEASVNASLNTAKQEVKQGKNIAAKRRDDRCESNPKNLCARGWELIDSGNAGPQRIIWQAYDKNNYYFNFMASAEKAEFGAARSGLQSVIDSIKFE